jgi:hypothetical protein
LAIASHNERKYRDFIEAKPKEFANNRVQLERKILLKTRNNETVVPLKIVKKAVLSTNLSQTSLKSPGSKFNISLKKVQIPYQSLNNSLRQNLITGKKNDPKEI